MLVKRDKQGAEMVIQPTVQRIPPIHPRRPHWPDTAAAIRRLTYVAERSDVCLRLNVMTFMHQPADAQLKKLESAPLKGAKVSNSQLGRRKQIMPNDDAEQTSNSAHRLSYEIAQSASDPNLQWQLIGKDPFGNECCRVGFRTYGDAWRAAERRKSNDDLSQADLLTPVVRQQAAPPSEYKADILTWSERQALLLRRIAAGEKLIDQVDWENVIEEVGSAGRRQLAEVKSLLVQALAAQLRVWAWPRSLEIGRWQAEALSFQREAAEIVTPAMRRRIDINEFYFKAIRRLPRTMDGAEAPFFPTECPVRLEELLRD